MTDLQGLIHSKFVPGLSERLPEVAELRAIVLTQGLSIEELKNLEGSEVIANNSYSMPNEIYYLLWCRLCVAALRTETFDLKAAETFIGYFKAIHEHLGPAFSVNQDLCSYMARLYEGITSSEKINSVLEFIKGLHCVKEIWDSEEVNKEIERAFQWVEIILNKADKTVKWQQYIELLGQLKVFKLAWFESYQKYFTMKALGELINRNERTEEVTQLLGLIQSSGTHDAETSSLLERVKERFSQGTFPLVSSKAQLQLDPEPLYTSTSESVTLRELKGTIEGLCTEVFVTEYTSADSSLLRPYLVDELNLIQRLSSQSSFFLAYYGHYYHDDDNQYTFGIVTESFSISLLEYIQQEQVSEAELYALVKHFVELFAYLDSQEIYHNSIQPSNIVYAAGTWKVSRFRICSFVSRTKLRALNKDFLPPEVLTAVNTGQSTPFKRHKVDIYSLGLVFLFLYFRALPSELNTPEGQTELRVLLTEVQYPWLCTLLERMLSFDFNQRSHLKTLPSRLANIQ